LKDLIPSKHIVKLYSFGEGILERGYSIYSYRLFNYFNGEDTIRYAIFEYLPNGELYNYILKIKKKLPEDLSRKIFYDLVKAVETCHKCGITHGDIKLENILLSSNYNIKLIDFGFAKRIDEGLISSLSGTKGYAAPECFIASSKKYSGIPSDIFSLGVVLFLLVMGFYPFEKPNCTDNKYKLIMKKDFNGFWKKSEKILCEPNTKLSNEFKNLFEKMICYNAEERISINEIKNHPWFFELTGKNNNCNNNSNYNNKNELNNNGNNSNFKTSNISNDDNKIVNKGNNNGDNIMNKKKYNKFGKSAKDPFNKGKNVNEIIINNKDDISNNNIHMENSPKQISKYKELEQKCAAELSKRKEEINEILEQEEDEED
jgi:serine/threonine protein kinase